MMDIPKNNDWIINRSDISDPIDTIISNNNWIINQSEITYPIDTIISNLTGLSIRVK